MERLILDSMRIRDVLEVMKINSSVSGVNNIQLCEKLEEDFLETFDALMDKVRVFVRGKLVGNRVKDSEKKPRSTPYKGRDQKE